MESGRGVGGRRLSVPMMQQPSFASVLAAAAALAAATVALLSWMSLAQMILLSVSIWAAAMEIRWEKGDTE